MFPDVIPLLVLVDEALVGAKTAPVKDTSLTGDRHATFAQLQKKSFNQVHIANIRGLSSTLDGDGGIAAPKKNIANFFAITGEVGIVRI